VASAQGQGRLGGVVTEAQPLMVIVPQDNRLEVEAFPENRDIGFVTAGQEAEVKVDTFQYPRYGTLPARVISVSHNAIDDAKTRPGVCGPCAARPIDDERGRQFDPAHAGDGCEC
jgi:multidrug resistance efflux pump